MTTLQRYRKKKLEMVVDAACVQQLLKICDRAGAKGHTIIPNASGKGHQGVRSNEGDILDVFRNVLLIVVAPEEVVETIIAESQQILDLYAGVLFVSDVEVVRNDHF